MRVANLRKTDSARGVVRNGHEVIGSDSSRELAFSIKAGFREDRISSELMLPAASGEAVASCDR